MSNMCMNMDELSILNLICAQPERGAVIIQSSFSYCIRKGEGFERTKRPPRAEHGIPHHVCMKSSCNIVI